MCVHACLCAYSRRAPDSRGCNVLGLRGMGGGLVGSRPWVRTGPPTVLYVQGGTAAAQGCEADVSPQEAPHPSVSSQHR